MEDSRAGREDRTPEQAFMNSPGSQDAEKIRQRRSRHT
jgi:hypothetical protein